MAHTKSAGAAKYGRDSQPKYLGVKKTHGEKVKIGDILIRQRGTKFFPGEGVKRGGDDTLFALREGIVKFVTRRKTHFDGSRRYAKVISVIGVPR
ncbi:MAG: 50S ribosomal protein L27 [Candidatus Sungbacteria bacterium RIFCSPHIGHO2_02_FULL_47_11]|uniref:Large ribosomal subunit protein bL27 n=1 Tax=Candidatus Sungbacteria bacterium RIFCSPHIGHO2_02_FULL_47_11 TaxID=1802270 RepID=A0A1G2KGE4_9BACT|nr:MAG: 50S ribosomal protein L27 [Candidatus Sungbacteria bacterium RIFCSPHIGHO2_02_FULL_47_11]